jgi:hypothetical protein
VTASTHALNFLNLKLIGKLPIFSELRQIFHELLTAAFAFSLAVFPNTSASSANKQTVLCAYSRVNSIHHPYLADAFKSELDIGGHSDLRNHKGFITVAGQRRTCTELSPFPLATAPR